jgi:hypothetical protein
MRDLGAVKRVDGPQHLNGVEKHKGLEQRRRQAWRLVAKTRSNSRPPDR